MLLPLQVVIFYDGRSLPVFRAPPRERANGVTLIALAVDALGEGHDNLQLSLNCQLSRVRGLFSGVSGETRKVVRSAQCGVSGSGLPEFDPH